MNWKIYAQNPEDVDEQGIYVKAEGEAKPWQSEVDAEEFDAIHSPSEAGYSVRDLASAKRWAAGYGLDGDVVEFEVW